MEIGNTTYMQSFKTRRPSVSHKASTMYTYFCFVEVPNDDR